MGITASENIFIIDYKNINGGDVQVLDAIPNHNCVHLTNENCIEIFYVAFKENALKVKKAQGQVKQCECVLFPTSLNDSDWMLFVETKYASNLKNALNEKANTMRGKMNADEFRDYIHGSH